MSFLSCTIGVVVFFVILFILRCIELFIRSFKIKNFKNKNVLITGCDSGFGLLLAKKLDKQGVRVIATCLTDEGVERLEKECSSKLKAVTLDVTDEEAVSDFAEYLTYELGQKGLHGLVNNAGIGEPSAMADVKHVLAKDMRQVFEVNTFAHVTMMNCFIPLLEKAKGRIVNMTSLNGRVVDPTLTNIPYTTSKAAAEAVSDSYRILFKAYDIPISVHIIEPGFIQTEILNPEKMLASFERGVSRYTPEEKDQADEQRDLAGKFIYVIQRLASRRTGKVVRAYENALFSIWPKKRYGIEVGLELLITYLPTWMQDWAILFQFYYVYQAALRSEKSAFPDKSKNE